LAITADARLDDREGLARQIGVAPPELAQMPDGRLILRAYRKWGRACPQHILGDFAFAIWDAGARTLFCARDHIGLRPFYYNLTTERFVFATDLAALRAVPGISDSLDEPYVASHLRHKFFTHTERTLFEAARKLPPGHTLTIRPDTTHLERYWCPEQVADVRFKTGAEYVEAFLDIYTHATRDCLRAVHPVGIHLSGGLDSSSVAVMASRELDRQGRSRPSVYTWNAPPGGEIPLQHEHARIESICAQEDLTCQYQTITRDDVISVLQWDLDRLPLERVLINEDALQRLAAAQGVRVLLSGWGGDEGISFDGATHFAGLFVRGQWERLYRESRADDTDPLHFLIRRVVRPLWETAQEHASGNPPRMKTNYASSDFLRDVTPLKLALKRPALGGRQQQRYRLAYGWVTNRLDTLTANGARHNVEYRYPLLDRRVLEFALGLPPDMYVKGPWNRWFMRTAMDGILPRDVCWNPDKTDPSRIGAVVPLLKSALTSVGRILADRATWPTRAVYLDMPRLLEDLAPDSFDGRRGLGSRLHALQFLDF
jgi:asparagine synthase (glutamine-hydrolysing)